MNKNLLGYIALASVLMLASAPTLACGEGMINAGKGLPYQGYLAPRPATVLIYASPDPTASDADREVLYAGLTKAGHKLTVVKDAAALASALRERHYDVVITAFDAVDTVKTATADVGSTASNTALLPVVARSDRDSPQLRSRFNAFLIDGASLGQYLKMIGKVLPANTL
jgi:hypothetical protein